MKFIINMNNLNKKAIEKSILTRLSNIELVGYNKEQKDDLPRRFEGEDLLILITNLISNLLPSSAKVYVATFSQNKGQPAVNELINTYNSPIIWTKSIEAGYEIGGYEITSTEFIQGRTKVEVNKQDTSYEELTKVGTFHSTQSTIILTTSKRVNSTNPFTASDSVYSLSLPIFIVITTYTI